MGEYPDVNRRTVLRATGATALSGGLSGCMGVLSSDNDDDAGETLVLDPPENYEQQKDLEFPYPTYGEELPSVSVPAPLHDRAIDTTEFVGERHVLLTFIYTSCMTVCPGLTNALRQVQADANNEGYADDMAFMPTTFDPEYDTADVLRSYGEDYGVDFTADNWYFLRPESPADAKEIVTDTFGVGYEQKESEEMDHERHFTHFSLVLLANKDGLIERAYSGEAPSPDTVIEDVRTLVDSW